jgi:hypothetical protein
MRPNDETFAGLRRHLQSYDAWHLQHFSEQTGLNCFFANRSSYTMPCSTLYDISTPRHLRGAMNFRNCIKHSGFGLPACEAATTNIEHHCLWSHVRRITWAVHFKGKLKPWHHDPRMCRPLRDGPLVVGHNTTVGVHDDLHWDPARGACTSSDTGQPVRWHTGDKVPRPCCLVETLAQSEWYQLLGGYDVRAVDL